MKITIPRSIFAPEVVQTSAMDCGPAALKCLLEGFGIPISYGRLREACQTDVDGTSIDTLEETALQLGLDAEQIMIPTDHLLLPQAQTLPAVVVVQLPNGVTHFVVLWGQYGSVVQVMDPATGRRWPTAQHFFDEIYIHSMPVSASAWRDWAGSDEFLNALRERLNQIGLSIQVQNQHINTALTDSGWRSLATLDAATRLVASLIHSKVLRKGQQDTCNMLETLIKKANDEVQSDIQTIPADYWSARYMPDDEGEEEQLLLRGAVLVRIKGLRTASSDSLTSPNPLSPDLITALKEIPDQPQRELIKMLAKDGLLKPISLIGSLLFAAVGIVIEALFLRNFLDLSTILTNPTQRLNLMIALLCVGFVNMLLRFPVTAGSLFLGRQLELRFRQMFLQKIPRINDRYFQSRLISDMAERSHQIQQLRLLPGLGTELIRTFFILILTTIGIAWFSPVNAILAVLTAILVVAIPLAANPTLVEQDLRMRSHAGALSRFYLDALLGLVAIRIHDAAQSMQREQENLLTEWARTGIRFYRSIAVVDALLSTISFGLAILLIFTHIAHSGIDNTVLLLAYWVTSLPKLGQDIALLLRQYPAHRNITLRTLEPLSAPEEPYFNSETTSHQVSNTATEGVAISLQDVSVNISGHTILDSITLDINSGSHIAIIGSSGAGKSSLVGLFLGWHRPISGQILIDGQSMYPNRFEQLRSEIAWVDPSVQLWNRSILYNLRYGTSPDINLPIDDAIEEADLQHILEKFPTKEQMTLGEGGGLLSGGEGQRMRFGRAVIRPNVRLVILDEPFRGLDRKQRQNFLTRARLHWPKATLLCITHDVSETQTFERVVVMDAGRIIEDGTPASLAKKPNSRYRALLKAETTVQKDLWSNKKWHRLWLQDGHLTEIGQGHDDNK